jgi:hypothetical protein
MSAKELTRRAMAAGALTGCQGATPVATMYSILWSDKKTFGRVDGKFFLRVAESVSLT